jgi:hypothetical protein
MTTMQKTAIVTAAAAANTTTSNVSYQKPYTFQQFLRNPGSFLSKDLWKGWLRIDHFILLAKIFNNIVTR